MKTILVDDVLEKPVSIICIYYRDRKKCKEFAAYVLEKEEQYNCSYMCLGCLAEEFVPIKVVYGGQEYLLDSQQQLDTFLVFSQV